MSSLKISLDAGLRAQLRQFEQKLKDEVIASAVAAGAKVLYDELLLRVPIVSGVLESSIYRYMDPNAKGTLRSTYWVGVNMAKAPHWHLVEYGHMQSYQAMFIKGKGWVTLKNRPLSSPRFVPGRPFIRPTATAKMGEALEAVKKRFAEKIREVST